MKKILLISATLMLAHAAFSQGTVTFNNHVGSSTATAPGSVWAPVYGLASDNRRVTGNTATGVPMGSQSYAGIPYLFNDTSHTFQATLWALSSTQPLQGDSSANNLQQVLVNGTATFRVNTSGSFAGVWDAPLTPAPIPGVTSETDHPYLQVRVWDTSKASTWDLAISTPGSIYGYSDIFQVPYPLGGTQSPPNQQPNMQGLQSFNVQLVPVPEPSVIALGVLGAGCLFLLRRRK